MSTFDEILTQILALLQREGRLAYRALKLRFGIDDEYVAALKEELIDAKRLAVDEDGKVLVWVGNIDEDKGKRITDEGGSGEDSPESRVQSPESKSIPPPDPRHERRDPKPVVYTPAHLAERIRATVVTDGERKTITALFADLKGSTALIEGLDPEEARAIIDPALQLMMDAVHQYDGYVAQALGDGVFALFGAPIAHEDHPQRALYAALRMQEEMRRYADMLRVKGYPPLLMRVGVNTGEVVLRSIRKDDLHADYVPIGHSTNLAARMEQLAAPGSILVTTHTHKLTDGYFAFKDLGQTQIKGVEEPLNVYEVLGAGPLRTRLQVSARRGLTRFVGRHSEMEQMQRALEQAKAGHGQIVGVMGEPGLGKSRLFYEFKLLSQSDCLILEAYSVSYGKASPYLPVIELLKSYLRIEPHDDERTRREKVTGKVLTLDRSLEDTLPYLFALLGIEEQPSPLQQMDPQIRRRRTFEALKKLFLRESLNQPLMVLFEDLHWIDSETQGFLDTLSESVASTRLLLFTNYRPEYRHEWGQKTYYTQLRLSPFGTAEAEEFLDVLLGVSVGADLRVGPQEAGAHVGAPLRNLKHLILEKTEGTPFFMEEVVQTLAEEEILVGERGNYRIEKVPTELHISPTVQGVLAARIDRLAPEEKALLQQLAVIGREFPVSLLRQVITQPEDELYRLLASLQRKEFLYEQPAFPEVEYIFKHALTQEVAYNSVLQERRKALHERTAQAIEALYNSSLDDHYNELAHHYTRSGNTEKAVEYLHLAGQQAMQRSAYVEAITHLSAALRLFDTLPNTPQRAAQELRVQITLGPALMRTEGYAAVAVEQVYTRARELCQQIGETPQLFPVLWGLSAFYRSRGDLRTSCELATQCLTLAERAQNRVFLCAAHRTLGLTLMLLGELSAAHQHLEQVVALYDRQQDDPLSFLYGSDHRVVSLSVIAFVLYALGYSERALATSQEALIFARKQSRLHDLAFAQVMAALLHQHRQDAILSQQYAEAAIKLSTEQGFQTWEAQGRILRGGALAERGQAEEGVAQMRQALTASQPTGPRPLQVEYLGLLARVYAKAGNRKEGLRTVAEAITIVAEAGTHWYEAELYRIKGTLTLESKVASPKSKVEEAEDCFLKAIAVAQKQQAKSLELRAVMSLARLWQRQGKTAAARQRLAEIYGWFTEGFDTKDLQEAKALLEELG